jgi:hypothetical protein
MGSSRIINLLPGLCEIGRFYPDLKMTRIEKMEEIDNIDEISTNLHSLALPLFTQSPI